jgi:hypothetical protein
MRIHTDKISHAELHRIITSRDGLYPEIAGKGSRKRDHAFELGIEAEPGKDAHGIKRSFGRNSGNMGAAQGYGKAPTWVEYGDIMVELFKLDPAAIIGPYDGEHNFITETQRAAPYRPARENAEEHADRWSEELYWERAAREMPDGALGENVENRISESRNA